MAEFRDPRPSTDLPAPRARRSVFGRAFRGLTWFGSTPLDWAGVHRIRQSASLIRDLFGVVRRGTRDPVRGRAEGDPLTIQLVASMSPLMVESALTARLAVRRRQTARIAYATAALSGLFLLAWLWRALLSSWSDARISAAMAYIPFCLLFLLLAFYNALLNFQIRTGRLASWREYIATDEGFWPS